jgi:opacity protein-like surface antigen
MRKLILISIVAILFTSNLYSQNSGWSFNAEAGAAIPAGKFGSKNIKDLNASFAEIGPTLNLGFNYKLKKHFGLSFLFSLQQNNTDTKTIDSKLRQAYPDYEFESTANNWLTWKFMTGAYISLPLDKKNKIYFTARAMIGFLKPSTYKFSQYQKTNPTDTASLQGNPIIESYETYWQSLKTEFTYLAGIGLQYNLTEKISLKTNIDYSAATLHFLRYGYSNSGGVLSGTTNPPTQTIAAYPSQPLATINWLVGVGINL